MPQLGKVATDKWYAVLLASSIDGFTKMTGITTPNQATAYWATAGATSWNLYTILATAWREVGSGLYHVALGAGLATEGDYLLQVRATGCRDFDDLLTVWHRTQGEVIDYTDALLDYTGTSGVKIAPAQTIATVNIVAMVNALAANPLATIADSVWDELLSAHTAATSAGYYLAAAGGGASTADIAAAVWAAGTRALTDKAGFGLAADQSAVIIGTVNVARTVNIVQTANVVLTANIAQTVNALAAGVAIGTVNVVQTVNALSAGAATAIAYQVWEENVDTLHTAATSAGYYLAAAGGGASTADIAAAVWAAGTRALTDKAGFGLAADQSAVIIGTVNVARTVNIVQTANVVLTANIAQTVNALAAGLSIGTVNVVQTVNALSAGAATAIAYQIWEENVDTLHTAASSAGEALTMARQVLAGKAIANESSNAVAHYARDAVTVLVTLTSTRVAPTITRLPT